MKRLEIFPLTDEKMRQYVSGELKLIRARSSKKSFFTKANPKGTAIQARRRAYYRVWHFKNRVPNMPEAAKALELFYQKAFPESYRGPNRLTRAAAAAPKATPAAYTDAPAANGKAPRRRLKSKKLVLAYKKGYNAARRSQEAKIQALKESSSSVMDVDGRKESHRHGYLEGYKAGRRLVAKQTAAIVRPVKHHEPAPKAPEPSLTSKVKGFFGL
jgi:hypothetical protein